MCGITWTVAPRILAAPLFRDDGGVDFAGREIAGAARAHAHEALVVAQVEIGFRAIVGNVHLAVLERAHRARVDVDVWIELHQAHLQAARFEDRPETGRGNTFAERGTRTPPVMKMNRVISNKTGRVEHRSLREHVSDHR